MKLLSIDLELNQPSQKIIQVGACVFRKKDGVIIDKFMVYVNPQEKLAPEITKLTGITQDQVETHGYSCKEAYFKLKQFAKKHKVFKNPILWGSGSWNDALHLYKEADPGEPNFMGHRVLDVKTLYQMYRIENGEKVKGGLEDAIKELGLTFEGKSHNALWDAINTVKVYNFLSAKLKKT
jgi:inhibitor of KinA sporulation pathway (predicted exonuclease)